MFGGPHRKIAVGNQLADYWTRLHCRGFVVLVISHSQMSSMDTAALLQKIVDGEWTFVIDNASRFIDQLIAKLGNERLNGDLVNRTIDRYTCNDIAEGNHFTEFWMDACQAIM